MKKLAIVFTAAGFILGMSLAGPPAARGAGWTQSQDQNASGEKKPAARNTGRQGTAAGAQQSTSGAGRQPAAGSRQQSWGAPRQTTTTTIRAARPGSGTQAQPRQNPLGDFLKNLK